MLKVYARAKIIIIKFISTKYSIHSAPKVLLIKPTIVKTVYAVKHYFYTHCGT